jgi:hypothetical protein
VTQIIPFYWISALDAKKLMASSDAASSYYEDAGNAAMQGKGRRRGKAKCYYPASHVLTFNVKLGPSAAAESQ